MTELQVPRYFLKCVRCDRTLWLHRNRPRVALCDRCKAAPKRYRKTEN